MSSLSDSEGELTIQTPTTTVRINDGADNPFIGLRLVLWQSMDASASGSSKQVGLKSANISMYDMAGNVGRVSIVNRMFFRLSPSILWEHLALERL